MNNEHKTEIVEIDTLGYHIDRALNGMVKLLNKKFVENDIDLQHAQYIILQVLWCCEGISQSQLSGIIGKDPAAICRALKYLESKGYVERQDKNGKTNAVFLTDYAHSMRHSIESVVDSVIATATAGITPGGVEILKQMLDTIYYNSK